MTEMSPVGSAGALKPSQSALSREQKLAVQSKQGWAPFGVEMKIVDDENKELPWDGKRFGRLKVEGFAVVESYFKDEGGKILDDQGLLRHRRCRHHRSRRRSCRSPIAPRT